MEARLLRTCSALALFCLSTSVVCGASFRTQHFLVTAPNAGLAREIGEAAEAYRHQLAVEWLGRPLGPWRDICPIVAQVSPQLGAGGATSFTFHGDQPLGWQMSVQGSRERILDSVLPHEITHTIFATHFGRPVPRWADEGACTTVEHVSERAKQERLLYEFLSTDRGIAFNQMFAMTEYPSDILPLYSQGYSLARYLIAQGGKQKFLAYVGDGMDGNDWPSVTEQHYGYQNLSELQLTWLDWVRSGQPLPPIAAPRDTATGPLVASRDANIANAALQRQPSDVRLASAAAPTSTARGDVSGASFGNNHPASAYIAANTNPPRDSWYAKHRQAAPSDGSQQSIVTNDARPENPFGAAAEFTSLPTLESVRANTSRPQAMQGVRETILEWGQPQSIVNPTHLGQSPRETVRR